MTLPQPHPSNYTPGRTRSIDRIVLHYTAGDGDTARDNCCYFSGANRNASAHYFVDEDGVCPCVPEGDTAWHAGSWAMNCRSVGVEMCSRKKADGRYEIPAQTVEHTVRLVRELMGRYGVPPEGVLRHYDVTGKNCPAPMVEDESQWKSLLLRLTLPRGPDAWAGEACAWAVEKGLFHGDGNGDFRWQDPVTRQELAAVLRRMQN